MKQSELKLPIGATAGSGRSGAGPAPEQRLPIGGRAPPLGLACTPQSAMRPGADPATWPTSVSSVALHRRLDRVFVSFQLRARSASTCALKSHKPVSERYAEQRKLG